MTVFCQNFDKHSPGWRDKEFKIFGQTLPRIQPISVRCIDYGEQGFWCPKCSEFVELGPEVWASWGPVETRAGYPKSMIRIL